MSLPARNLLAQETSPYLQQHGDNPVHWRSWSAEALREAKELDRPILLSIGYAACHWCHVMAHESFESQTVAAVMNRHFVNIKVDREERPDIDQIYMAALTAMGEQGGWPLTMFLTPDGRPFWGGTYFPPSGRYGKPGFVDVLNAIQKAWTEQRDKIGDSASAVAAHVEARLAAVQPPSPLDGAALSSLADNIFGMIDHRFGGLKGAPKFPNAPFMHTLWLSWLRDGYESHRDAVVESLRLMLRGGIYDHIGGGLARYSTDAQWIIPHFEKMLYDNAQVIRLANWAYAATGDELFRIRIEETIDWLLREMRADDGSFTSSLDADSEGEEGLFYTWSDNGVSTSGIEFSLFYKYLSLSKPESWEGDPVILQTADQVAAEISHPEDAKALKQTMLAHRAGRTRPGRDDKSLVDWNGLTIAALAEAGRSLNRPDWVAAAGEAFRAVLAAADEKGRLPHSFRGKSRLYPALSSDYAAMISAAISLFEATRNESYVRHAQQFFGLLEQWHGDGTGSGYFFTASDSKDVPARIRGDVDEAVPSATGQIIEALAGLAALISDPALQGKTIAVAEHALGRAAAQAYGQAGILNAAALLMSSLKLVIVDDLDQPSLVPVVNRNPDPRRVDIILPVGTSSGLAALPGAVFPDSKKPGAYLCAGPVCLPMIDNPVELERALRSSIASGA